MERRRCFGTDETGSGTKARHSLSAGAFGITTRGVVAGTSATVTPDATNEVRVAESFRSEPAQQLSACAWVTCGVDRDPCDSDLCIGQEASS
jgi:hypothetical protein